jgi:hypothetical protein
MSGRRKTPLSTIATVASFVFMETSSETRLSSLAGFGLPRETIDEMRFTPPGG